MDVSLYLFTGFLESGKSTLIKRMLQDGKLYSDQGSALLILCEEGDVLYPDEFLAQYNLQVEICRSEEQYTVEYLEELQRKSGCNHVIVEYNGFWPSGKIYRVLPANWTVKDKFFCADAKTIASYHANLEMQTEDKIKYSSMSLFNRITPGADTAYYHTLVRKNSRRSRIFYTFTDGVCQEDLELDEPPYCLSDSVIDLSDSLIAYWMHDMQLSPPRYVGLTVRFCGFSQRTEDGQLLVGRDVTFAMAKDAEYWGLVCSTAENISEPEPGAWHMLTAKIFDNPQQDDGLSLCVIACEQTHAPAQPIIVLV